MKVTTANWYARPEFFAEQAAALRAHVVAAKSELVLLLEMPFTPWLALSDKKVQAEWDQSAR